MKVLVTGAWNCTSEQLKQIEKLGHTVIFMQNEKDELPCPYEEVEGVICNGLFLSHPIEKFTSLRYIQLISAGFDRVPMDYVNKKGIAIYNARGVYGIPMAEFAVCGVLNLYKQSRFFYDNQKKCKWEKNRDVLELFGKTVCIIGCGNIGTECAKRFKVFGCCIVGVDIKPYENEFYDTMFPLENLDDALRTADITVLTLPLTDETRHLINGPRFAVMKQGSVVVNIARGAIVDTDYMINALKTKLLGAVLDVFEEEPLDENSELWTLDNVVITPHNSFVGDGNQKRIFECIYTTLLRLGENN